MSYFTWSRNKEAAGVIDLSLGFQPLLDKYGRDNPVLKSVLGHAWSLGAETAIVEYRYIDQDYRSEHRDFYAGTFRRYPSVAERLLFFRGRPPAQLIESHQPADFSDLHFLGYSVMRPLVSCPVGRTVLDPGSALGPYVSCKTRDRAHLFGRSLPVIGSPFLSQDSQLGTCSHVTAWITAYYHHRRFASPRYRPGDIASMVPPETGVSRPMPSSGLTVAQLLETFRRIGLPAIGYRLDRLPKGESLFRIACRYLNSGMPVTVLAGDHAFVLVGYKRVRCGTDDERIRFIRQDDEVGPYQLVSDPFGERQPNYRPWRYLIVPLPPRVYVPGEDAEQWGAARLRRLLETQHSPLVQRWDAHELSPRSVLMESTVFKERQVEREASDVVKAIYTRMALPHWVWVVELTDRAARDRGDPCVLAEALIDTTNPSRDRQVIAWRVPDEIGWWLPDHDEFGSVPLDHDPAVRSLALVESRCVPEGSPGVTSGQ